MTHPLPTLTSLLGVDAGPAGEACQYLVCGTTATLADLELAAQLLADYAMRVRCGQAAALQVWRNRRDGGPPDPAKRTVAALARIGFGLPDSPATDDHYQGHVAELLWNCLVSERTICPDGRQLVHVSEAKPDPTEPGGDGLVVYEVVGGVLVYRLWEIKKHLAAEAVREKVRKASNQLSTRGEDYLAKMVAPGSLHPGALGALFADLVELWLDRSPRAGVGVAVGTSHHHATDPSGAFAPISTVFTHFDQPGQIEGLMIAFPDFAAFAKRVREVVWTGL